MLRKVPFFGGLDPAKLKLLAFTSRAVRFDTGENLMSRGEPPDSVYVIIEGEVQILGETPAGEFIVAVVGRNELQGEMGVITNTPRGATVRAKTPATAPHGTNSSSRSSCRGFDSMSLGKYSAAFRLRVPTASLFASRNFVFAVSLFFQSFGGSTRSIARRDSQ